MFSNNPTIGEISESTLIEHISDWLGPLSPESPEGIGDDCAVHSPPKGKKQIITSDALIYGQHFDTSISASQAGIKLINRNLSDIAAMGGTPDRAILNLLLGPDLELPWLKDFFHGIFAAASAVELKIVGGDIGRTAPGTFTSVLTLVGSSPRPLTRRSSQVGDPLFVTGELGGTLAGKHATFTPRLAEGQWLSRDGRCTALMDLTDGLAKDLPNFLASEQMARLDLPSIPASAKAEQTSRRSGRSVLEHAFCDGEDYELLFTLKASARPEDFIAAWQKAFPYVRISCIGSIHARRGDSQVTNRANGEPIPFSRGFEHFGPS